MRAFTPIALALVLGGLGIANAGDPKPIAADSSTTTTVSTPVPADGGKAAKTTKPAKPKKRAKVLTTEKGQVITTEKGQPIN